MTDFDFPVLFDQAQIDQAIPHDPTVDGPLFRPVERDPDPRHLLECEYPHVADRITGLWGSPLCAQYLQSLLMMDRGEARQGFPMELVEDLMLLDACHGVRFPATV